jgi:hypothetical protein
MICDYWIQGKNGKGHKCESEATHRMCVKDGDYLGYACVEHAAQVAREFPHVFAVQLEGQRAGKR